MANTTQPSRPSKLSKLFHKEVYKSTSEIVAGDVLLFRANNWIGWFISHFGGGIHSHVGIAHVNNEVPSIVEMREFVGYRDAPLSIYSGNTIDVFRPIPGFCSNDGRYITYDAQCAINYMMGLKELKYGWKRIWLMAKVNLPFIRWFTRVQIDDEFANSYIYPVCSTAVTTAINRCFADCCPFKPDVYVQPCDLAKSALLQYQFTVKITEKG
jgi:hypothetical protein